MLNLALSPEQEMLRDQLARLLRTQCTSGRVRATGAGCDTGLWSRLVEMGVTTIRCPAAAGGLDASLLETAIVAEEAGRALACVPLIEHIVAARLLCWAGKHAESIAQAVAGSSIATVALHPIQLGVEQVIPAAAVADRIIAWDNGQLVSYRGVRAEVLSNQTGSVPLGSCMLGMARPGVERHVLAEGDSALQAWLAAVEEWKLGTAAALVGLSEEAIRRAAAYSRERVQFGRPIGAFQGVAHPLADSITEIEGARLLTWRAITAVAQAQAQSAERTRRNAAGALISMAFWWATQSALRATERALRTFGGYGLSLENDIQLFYRRARALSLLAGDPEIELRRAGERLYADAPAVLPGTGPVSIDFEWGEAADVYAQRLRSFIAENAEAERQAGFHHSTRAHSKPLTRKLAQAGLLFPHLPPELGGEGRNPIEVAAADAVWDSLDWNDTAITLSYFVLIMVQQWGTPEARAEIIPRLKSGDAVGCLGFSEAGSGSDIFGCRFKAVRDGAEWILDGHKMFTTAADIADYILLLTRTSQEEKKHRGLTLFIVPMNLPGIQFKPLPTLQDERTNVTYFDAVRIPDTYRLGEAGDGMKVMLSALEFEHSGYGYHHTLPVTLRHAVEWARRSGRIAEAEVRRRLVRAAVTVQVSECLSRRDVWAQATGKRSKAHGPMSKLFATEGLRELAADLVALAAPYTLLARNDDLHYVEVAMRRALAMTIYGGTSEIQRSLIAELHLGMPKSRE